MDATATPAPTRRNVFSHLAGATAAAAILATGLPGSPAIPPIIAAGHRLRALWEHYEEADAKKTDQRGILADMMKAEAFVLDATPSTPEEAVVILMVAVSDISTGLGFTDPEAVIENAEFAVRRVAHWLADSSKMDLAAVGGDTYLPRNCQRLWAGRA